MSPKSAKKVTKTDTSKETPPARSSSTAKRRVSEQSKKSVKNPEAKVGKNGGKVPADERNRVLKDILLAKREALTQAIKQQLGQSLTDEQQRRLEAAMDSGDQALVDLEREMGISLQEMRNRERQMVDEALVSLAEGSYGMCAECGEEISEKRLEALPFARLCISCQSKRELMEKIERSEQRS